MATRKALGISLSFVGLLVGAGFATGQEVVQYFTSFGMSGVWGIIVAGVVMMLAGTAFLQLGSYFHAREHNSVFREVANTWVARFLDLCVIFTLFAVGFVMLAGAGSTLEQQFDIPAWMGSLGMLILVLVAGMLDVDKVSKVIGMLTPTIIIAVVGVTIYTALNLPDDVGSAIDTSSQLESPIFHWLVSALNYSGLALIMAVSMTLVIGGDHISPKETGKGGLVGGIIYLLMLGLAGFALLLNAEQIGDSDIPMLQIVDDINPILGMIMAVIIYLMVFNTAIGMFYALGKRLSAGHEGRYRMIFIGVCVAGFALSFVGFTTLMEYVYPVLGYLGIAMVIVLVYAWAKYLSSIKDESNRRERVRALLRGELADDGSLDSDDEEELGDKLQESNMDEEELYDSAAHEAAQDVASDSDKDVDDIEDSAQGAENYTSKG